MGFYISSTPPGQVSDTIFSLFLLPFLKQPLKREDGTEAKAEKNVMPIEGGWKNNTPGCQSFLAIRLLDKDRA